MASWRSDSVGAFLGMPKAYDPHGKRWEGAANTGRPALAQVSRFPAVLFGLAKKHGAQ